MVRVGLIAVALLSVGSLCGCRAANVSQPSVSLTSRLFTSPAVAERRARWDAWVAANIHHGDVIFTNGESRILLGLIDFSEVARTLSDSRFSHVGIAAVEEGRVVMYDIRNTGVHRTDFVSFLHEPDVYGFAVKRLASADSHVAAQAVEFCRQARDQRTPFDSQFRLDEDRLYCTELVEVAFRSAGVSLSEPVPLEDLPGYSEVARHAGWIQQVKGIDPSEPVYHPGNDEAGLWASPRLVLIADVPDCHSDPPTMVIKD